MHYYLGDSGLPEQYVRTPGQYNYEKGKDPNYGLYGKGSYYWLFRDGQLVKNDEVLDLRDYDDPASCGDWNNCADNRDQEEGIWFFGHFDARIDM